MDFDPNDLSAISTLLSPETPKKQVYQTQSRKSKLKEQGSTQEHSDNNSKEHSNVKFNFKKNKRNSDIVAANVSESKKAKPEHTKKVSFANYQKNIISEPKKMQSEETNLMIKNLNNCYTK